MIWFVFGFAAGLNVTLVLFYILFWPWVGCPMTTPKERTDA